MSFIETVGPFFLLLGLLIFIHEWGHFAVARFFGVRVEIFSIGFGKTIWSFRYGETDYRISIFPLGGYVKMYGDNPRAEIPEDQKAYSFMHQPVFPRMAIVLAGPVMNLILAFFIFFGMGLYGQPQTTATLGDIQAETTAYKSGLRSGDKILSLNSTSVKSYEHTLELIYKSKDAVHVQVLRDSETLDFKVPTEVKDNPNILSAQRQIPQIDGWDIYSLNPTITIASQESVFYQAGLRNLDTIKTLNGQDIKTFRQLNSELKTFKEGEVIHLTVERQNSLGKKDPLNFTLTATQDMKLYKSDKGFIGRVQKDSPAYKSGLKRGDHILSISKTPIPHWNALVEAVKTQGKEGKALRFLILRDYKEIEISVTPALKKMMNSRGKEISRPIVGIEPGFYFHVPPLTYVPAGGLIASLNYAWNQTGKWIAWTVNSIVRIIQGEVSPKNLGGFITIGQVAKDSLQVGWSYFLQIMAIISINLFLLNLIPIPVLDGGHLLFFIIEAVRGKPVSPENMERAFLFGFVLLISLVGLTLFNDVQRVFLSGW